MVVWVHLSCIHVKLFYSPYLCHSCFTWQEQVPVQVHRSLAYSDGIRPVEPARMAVAAGLSDGLLFLLDLMDSHVWRLNTTPQLCQIVFFLPDGLQTLLDLMDSHVWRLKSLDW